MRLARFLDDKEAGLSFIKEAIRTNNDSYKDNTFWFYFSIEGNNIISLDSKVNAEYVASCGCDMLNDIDYVMEACKKYGYELEAVEGCAKRHGYNSEEDIVVWHMINDKIIDKFIDDVIDDFKYTEEFDDIAELIYAEVSSEIVESPLLEICPNGEVIEHSEDEITEADEDFEDGYSENEMDEDEEGCLDDDYEVIESFEDEEDCIKFINDLTNRITERVRSCVLEILEEEYFGQ
jgi:hypothetical protein